MSELLDWFSVTDCLFNPSSVTSKTKLILCYITKEGDRLS